VLHELEPTLIKRVPAPSLNTVRTSLSALAATRVADVVLVKLVFVAFDPWSGVTAPETAIALALNCVFVRGSTLSFFPYKDAVRLEDGAELIDIVISAGMAIVVNNPVPLEITLVRSPPKDVQYRSLSWPTLVI
jgi:hypothetical protein